MTCSMWISQGNVLQKDRGLTRGDSECRHLQFEEHVCHTSPPSFLKLHTRRPNSTWKSHRESRRCGPLLHSGGYLLSHFLTRKVMETWSSPAFSQCVESLPPAIIIKPHVASTFHAPSVPHCLVRVSPHRVLGNTLKLRLSPCLPVSSTCLHSIRKGLCKQRFGLLSSPKLK